MAWAVSGVLTVLALFYAVRLNLLYRSIRIMREDLHEINSDTKALRCLNTEAPDPYLEGLAEEINLYIREACKDASRQKRREKEIRDEITHISHDLRTPLTSILGYLELVEEGELDKEQKEYMEVARRRSLYLSQLIDELYEYSRLENGEQKGRPEQVELTGLFREHLLSSYPEFEKKGLEADIALSEEEIRILGDCESLERIFNNLTSNCIKYGQGKAAISLKRLGREAILTYQNAVAGLTQEDTAHLFDRFYRKDEARNVPGSGLGLTVAKLLTEQMGGSMDAALVEGNLRITCRFPVCLQNPAG